MNEMVGEITEVGIVINSLSEIYADVSVPRNVRTKIEFVLNTLKDNIELSTKVNKALNELGGISTDANLQAYTRTQIWNAMSALEKL